MHIAIKAARWSPSSLFRATLTGLLVTSWTALFLASIGHFQAGYAILAGAVGAGWLLCYPVHNANGWTRTDLIAVTLALGSLWLTLPPHLYMLGGWDPGVYVHTAAAVDRYGTLQFPEADLCALQGETRDLFARNLHGIVEPFLGIRVVAGRYVSPQFYHLFPSLMAVLWPLGGATAGLLLNPLLNVFSLLAFYAVLKKLGGPTAGLVGLLLLLLHPAQIWQARFPSAEMLTQTLLWSGFALLLRLDLTNRSNSRDALLAGCALGAAQLARYDTLMLLAPLSAVLLFSLLITRPRRTVWLILLPIGLLAMHAWLHQKWVAPFYAPISGVVRQTFVLIALAAATVLATALFTRGRAFLQRLFSGPSLRWMLMGFLAIWWIFGLTVRPHLPDESMPARQFSDWFSQLGLPQLTTQLAGKDAGIGLYLLALWGWPALLAAMAGTLYLLWRERGRMTTAWLAGCVAVTLVLTYRIYNDHFMMWLSRRFIPIVIPFFTVGLATVCVRLTARLPRQTTLAALLLGLLLIAPRLPASYRMATMRDWNGLNTWLDQTAALLPNDAMLISDQAGFAASLRYLKHVRAYELNPRCTNGFPRLMTYLQGQQTHEPVYLLTRRYENEISPPEWTRIADLPLLTERMEHSRFDVPSESKRRGGPFALYQWTASNPGAN